MTNRSTLISDLLYFIKNDLSSNITDPIAHLRGNSSKFVMTSFPEREVKYPLIVLQINNITESRAGMQTVAMDITLTVEIRIWAESITLSDKLCQQILDRLANIQFTANTGSVANDFHDFNIGSVVRIDELGEGGKKSRIIQLNYRFFNVS